MKLVDAWECVKAGKILPDMLVSLEEVEIIYKIIELVEGDKRDSIRRAGKDK